MKNQKTATIFLNDILSAEEYRFSEFFKSLRSTHYDHVRQRYKRILTALRARPGDFAQSEFSLMNNVHADGEDGTGVYLIHADYVSHFYRTDDFDEKFALRDLPQILSGLEKLELEPDRFPEPFKKTKWHLACEADTERLVGLAGETECCRFFTDSHPDYGFFVFVPATLPDGIAEIAGAAAVA